MKLHKLLYYCQGHHLASLGVPLFRETVSAWDMGPVVGEFWKQEREGAVPTAYAELDEAQLNTVGYVLSRYGGLSGMDLQHLTHSEEPWQLANRNRRSGESTRIERDWMRSYFRSNPGGDTDDVLLDSEAVTAWLKSAGDRRDEPAMFDSREAVLARLTRA
jgi:uncharacterized phage-associated protein